MKQSAGILLYRTTNKFTEVLLVHPGGPFNVKKDAGAWSIPKGEFDENEDPLQAAIREFEEETGKKVKGDFISLGSRKQNSSKIVYAWALESDFDTSIVKSNTFEMEWPPRSGKMTHFPEIDKAEWFSLEKAREKLLAGQVGFIFELQKILKKD